MLTFNSTFVGVEHDMETCTTPHFWEGIRKQCRNGGAEICTQKRVGCHELRPGVHRLFAAEGDGKDLEFHISNAVPVPGSLKEEDVRIRIADHYPELELQFGPARKPFLGVYLSPVDAILFLKKIMQANPEALIKQLEGMLERGEE